MYIRPVHAELDPAVLRAFARAHALGQLTTAIPHAGLDTLQTTHLPFVIDDPAPAGDAASAAAAPLGTLRAHIARANPQTKALLAAAAASPDGTLADDVLVLFTAPTHAYVSPRFYKTTKPATGKVVPTWDYAAVQVYGRLRVLSSGAEAGAWLQAQIAALSDEHEARAGGSWKVADAPAGFVDLLKKAIVGLEIEITKIEGRFKLSQEVSGGDWQGVVDGFRALGTEDGDRLAGMIEARGKQAEA